MLLPYSELVFLSSGSRQVNRLPLSAQSCFSGAIWEGAGKEPLPKPLGNPPKWAPSYNRYSYFLLRRRSLLQPPFTKLPCFGAAMAMTGATAGIDSEEGVEEALLHRAGTSRVHQCEAIPVHRCSRDRPGHHGAGRHAAR
jgi:hypothetical protein